MATAEHAGDRPEDTLTEARRRADYTPAEQRFSVILRQRLQDLLQGKCNQVMVLRKYPGQPDRLGVIATPADVARDQLRAPVVERLSLDTLGFIRSDAAGGPVSQSLAPDRSIVETRLFPTKYPHIVIERTDRFATDSVDPVEITWSLLRVQNQRAQTQLNRVLDAANLAFELVRLIR